MALVFCESAIRSNLPRCPNIYYENSLIADCPMSNTPPHSTHSTALAKMSQTFLCPFPGRGLLQALFQSNHSFAVRNSFNLVTMFLALSQKLPDCADYLKSNTPLHSTHAKSANPLKRFAPHHPTLYYHCLQAALPNAPRQPLLPHLAS